MLAWPACHPHGTVLRRSVVQSLRNPNISSCWRPRSRQDLKLLRHREARMATRTSDSGASKALSAAKKTVAIIGAGPAGLIAAKEAAEAGLLPTVFDASPAVGGMWRNGNESRCWPRMTTNLSYHTCSFSELPHPPGTPMFPPQRLIGAYLEQYAHIFLPQGCLNLGHQVVSVSPASPSRGADDWGGGAEGKAAGAPAMTGDEGELPWQWVVEWRRSSGDPALHGTATVPATGSQVQVVASAGEEQGTSTFDFVVVSSGFYGVRHLPPLPGQEQFQGPILHSSAYTGGSPFTGKHIVVVGQGHSGAQIAADLAACRVRVTHVLPRPMWVVPPMLPLDPGSPTTPFLPHDVLLNRRSRRGGLKAEKIFTTATEHRMFKRMLSGVQRDFPIVPSPLPSPCDLPRVLDEPVVLGVSDTYLGLYRAGHITVAMGRAVALGERSLTVELQEGWGGEGEAASGAQGAQAGGPGEEGGPAPGQERRGAAGLRSSEKELTSASGRAAAPGAAPHAPDAAAGGGVGSASGPVSSGPVSSGPVSSGPVSSGPVPSGRHEVVEGVDGVIMCTGYKPNLDFLPKNLLADLSYTPDDMYVPLLLHKSVFHPAARNMAFVGMYRAPYFSVMELQARWVAGVFSGTLPYPSPQQVAEGVAKEALIRSLRPRPSFPHQDHAGCADELLMLLEGQRGVEGDDAGGRGGVGTAAAAAGSASAAGATATAAAPATGTASDGGATGSTGTPTPHPPPSTASPPPPYDPKDIIVPASFRSPQAAAAAAADIAASLQAAKRGRGVAGAVFRSLPGAWSFTRQIVSALPSSPSGRVEGEATFTPTSTPDELLYTEQGTFTLLTGHKMKVWRKYVYVYEHETDRLHVYHAEGDARGAPFLQLVVEALGEKGEGSGGSISGQGGASAAGSAAGVQGVQKGGACPFAPSVNASDPSGVATPPDAASPASTRVGPDVPCPFDTSQGWVATSDHLCGRDMYHAFYQFAFAGVELGQLRTSYRVLGPEKDYVATTAYMRTGVPQPPPPELLN